MEKAKATYMDADPLIPYASNPRLNGNAVDAVAAGIKESGLKVPIAVDGENAIINGHTRPKAAHKLGLKNATREAEAATREAADAEGMEIECVWESSERERGIVAGPGKNDDDRAEREPIPEDPKR